MEIEKPIEKSLQIYTMNYRVFAVKEDIVYNASQDKLVGFVDLGRDRTALTDKPEAATHCLQFYIRSIMLNFSRPLMFLATKNISAYEQTSAVWEAIATAVQFHCYMRNCRWC